MCRWACRKWRTVVQLLVVERASSTFPLCTTAWQTGTPHQRLLNLSTKLVCRQKNATLCPGDVGYLISQELQLHECILSTLSSLDAHNAFSPSNSPRIASYVHHKIALILPHYLALYIDFIAFPEKVCGLWFKMNILEELRIFPRVHCCMRARPIQGPLLRHRQTDPSYVFSINRMMGLPKYLPAHTKTIYDLLILTYNGGSCSALCNVVVLCVTCW